MAKYSVLMSVYRGEKPSFLNRALQSIQSQSYPPAQIVLVKDGPLTSDLETVIDDHSAKLSLIQLEHNVGLGAALQKGLDACVHPIVARMDSDDIAVPTRCERQIAFLEENPDVDAVGSWISEFYGDEQNIYAYRILPTEPEALRRFARRRNPMNHMTVTFRRDSVLAAGGYKVFNGFEDYFLWVRMLVRGARLANIPEYLVNVRAGPRQLARRGGLRYAASELLLQREMLRLGYIGASDFALNCFLRLATRLSPMSIRRLIYCLIRKGSSRYSPRAS